MSKDQYLWFSMATKDWERGLVYARARARTLKRRQKLTFNHLRKVWVVEDA